MRGLLLLLLAVATTHTEASSCPTFAGTVNADCNTDSQCNTGGNCIRGICACSAQRIGTTCSVTDRFLKFGNVVVTQPGLDYAPDQYFAPIQEAFDNAKANGGLNIAQYDGPCTNANGDPSASYKVTVRAITPSMFTRADLIPSSVKFTITQTGVLAQATGDFTIAKAKLDLYGGKDCCPCTGTNCKRGYCVQVCSAADQADWIDFSFKATVGAYVDFTYSPSAPGLVASVGTVTVTFDDNSLGATLNCPSTSSGTTGMIENMVKSYFTEIKSQIAPLLTPMIRDQLVIVANRVASRYQGVQSYSPTKGQYLFYRVMGLSVMEQKYISVDVEAKVIYEQFSNLTANRDCYVNVTYADVSADYLLEAPKTWGPLVKFLNPSGLISPVLVGLRMTRSFFNAMAWASYVDSMQRREIAVRFQPTQTELEGNANIRFTVPKFKIPANAATNNVLRVSVDGRVEFSCPPTQQSAVLAFNFTQLDASFKLRYDDTPPQPSIAYQLVPDQFSVQQVSNVQTPQPALNNPTLLRSAMVGALNYQLDQIDQFMLQKGRGVLVLPPDLQAIFPDAQLILMSQSTASGAIAGESGYIEMIHRCACSSSPKPIANQVLDGTVEVCPRAILNNPYCRDITMRRRLLLDEAITVESRQLSTPQQEADLMTVLNLGIAQCVTRNPTLTPTVPQPSKLPSHLPTRLPTPPSVALEENASPCEETPTCKYSRDVWFFVCDEGKNEKRECRRGNSDIYCCDVEDFGKGSFGQSPQAGKMLPLAAAVMAVMVIGF